MQLKDITLSSISIQLFQDFIFPGAARPRILLLHLQPHTHPTFYNVHIGRAYPLSMSKQPLKQVGKNKGNGVFQSNDPKSLLNLRLSQFIVLPVMSTHNHSFVGLKGFVSTFTKKKNLRTQSSQGLFIVCAKQKKSDRINGCT